MLKVLELCLKLGHIADCDLLIGESMKVGCVGGALEDMA